MIYIVNCLINNPSPKLTILSSDNHNFPHCSCDLRNHVVGAVNASPMHYLPYHLLKPQVQYFLLSLVYTIRESETNKQTKKNAKITEDNDREKKKAYVKEKAIFIHNCFIIDFQGDAITINSLQL